MWKQYDTPALMVCTGMFVDRRLSRSLQLVLNWNASIDLMEAFTSPPGFDLVVWNPHVNVSHFTARAIILIRAGKERKPDVTT